MRDPVPGVEEGRWHSLTTVRRAIESRLAKVLHVRGRDNPGVSIWVGKTSW